MKILNFIQIIIFIYIFINIICGYQFRFKINQNSEGVVECGGPIDINDKASYPPCKTINEASNRSKLIKRDADNRNSSLVFYIIKESCDRTVSIYNETQYFGDIDYFEDIQILAVNENLERLKDPNQIVILSNKQSYFIEVTNKSKNSNDINQNVQVEGFTFKDWSHSCYIHMVSSYVANLKLSYINYNSSKHIVGFENRMVTDFELHLSENITIDNCNFNNGKYLDSYFQVKNVIINNSNYNGFGIKSVIDGNPKSLVINNCTFTNNSNFTLQKTLITQLHDGYIEITNCLFYNNTIETLISGGIVEVYSSIGIEVSNCSFIDNHFLEYESSSTLDKNYYIITLDSMKTGWYIKLKDVTFKLISNSINKNAGGLIGVYPGKGNIIIDNLSLYNYSFYTPIIFATDSTIKIYNSPTLNSSLIVDNNIIINNDQIISSPYINNNNSISNNNSIKRKSILISIIIFSVVVISIVIIVISFKKKLFSNFRNKYKNSSNNNNNYIDNCLESVKSQCDNITTNSDNSIYYNKDKDIIATTDT